MSRLPGENKKKVMLFFLSYCPLQIWILKLKTCNKDISKTITALASNLVN